MTKKKMVKKDWGKRKIKKLPVSPSKFLIGKRMTIKLRRVE